ncbi:MAG: hydroxymethylglutaryl-CoA reductase, degradative [Flavobacteriales bacterium TMED96]|nr:MAG: hydroxymethylglutaryl-CoA reductase, degradative [Flavobacteriales bacterium TMED96]
MNNFVNGFSKKNKLEKIDWIINNHFHNNKKAKKILFKYLNDDASIQSLHDEFIENTISNFYLPFAVAPNFLINGKYYTIPMAIEESSVVAAACNAAKFWSNLGGFKTKVLGVEKIGQVHFFYNGSPVKLKAFFKEIRKNIIKGLKSITSNMEKRGGGINSLELVDMNNKIDSYYQIFVKFTTIDSMGANFINTCLEKITEIFKSYIEEKQFLDKTDEKIDFIMSILSNYTPNCLVKSSVECKVEDLEKNNELKVDNFINAVKISKIDTFRAVTHNKGIMNGIDSVVIATGNDFRSVEAGIHAYASRNGIYSGLSNAYIKKGFFNFELTIPISIGTVGGLTKLHPLVNWAHNLLGNPNAETLMQIIAAAGLAQNFAAIKSLVTTGIQKGHMKMHLLNILNQLGANQIEKNDAIEYFKKKYVSHKNVREFLNKK